ncbi:MAG: hypothetical protein OEV59_04795 [Deltaproteobacteria bacterium]|nr:hypothetical protein [Deltaproteobacteria bacterium]
MKTLNVLIKNTICTFLTGIIFLVLGCDKKEVVIISDNKPELIMQISWGPEKKDILGLAKSPDFYGTDYIGFSAFYVWDGSLYLYDPVKERIAAYKNNSVEVVLDYIPAKLPHSTGDIVDIAVNKHSIYILDDFGFIERIDRNTGKVVVKRNESVWGEKMEWSDDRGAYHMYLLYDMLVVASGANACFNLLDITDIECKGRIFEEYAPMWRFKGNKYGNAYEYTVLDDHEYVYDNWKNVFLYKDGMPIEEMKLTRNDGEFKMFISRYYQYGKEGIYYIDREKEGIKLYLKKWSKAN